jgi:hypothetical protein
MKKILVVLLVLAVATGVFAQEGEFSFNGTAEIGAQVNFDPEPGTDGVKATSTWDHYHRTYGGWDGIRGLFGINYNRDVFGAGLTIDSNNGGEPLFLGSLNAEGENYQFTAKARLDELINGNAPAIHQLFGNYSFLNGVFFLETAYIRRWAGNDYWASDTTGAFRSWDGRSNEVVGGKPFRTTDQADHNTFTMRDGGAQSGYIAGDVRLQGLSFGLMMRDIFLSSQEFYVDDPTATGFVNVTTKAKIKAKYLEGLSMTADDWADLEKQGNLDALTGNNTLKDLYKSYNDVLDLLLDYGTVSVPMNFVDDVLKKMIFGVKFQMSPVEVAAQFLMEDYGVYIGGKWMFGPVTVGLSFMGILSEREIEKINLETYERQYKATENTHMKVGGGADYEADSFGFGIKGFYAIDGNKDKAKEIQITEIGIEPGFYYNVIPSHLRFQLDTGFYFFGYTSEGEKNGDKVKALTDSDGASTVQFALQPQLFWNFLGTGAGGYGGTGIALRYRIVGGDAKKYNPIDLNNKFDVNFKYSF